MCPSQLPTDTTAVNGAAESAPAVESVPDVEVSTAAALPKEPFAIAATTRTMVLFSPALKEIDGRANLKPCSVR